MNRIIWLFIIIIVGFSSLSAQIKHRFFLADGELSKIMYVDQFTPANDWNLNLTGKNCDFQLVGNNRLMVSLEYGTSSETGGFVEIDVKTGTVVRKCLNLVKKAHGMSARRLPSGNTLFCGDTLLTGLVGVSIVEYDSASTKVLRKFSYPGYASPRLMRRTPTGTFLFTPDTKVVEGDSTGKVIWEKTIPSGSSSYKATRLKNGNTLVSSGYGATIVEMTPSGSVVKTYGGANQAQATLIHPYYYGCFQVLSNGHIVLTNWQGHETNLGGVGIQVLEYDTTGAMVWYWKDSTRYSSLHTVLVVDSLDTKYLYDDRNWGVLERDPPMTAVQFETFNPQSEQPGRASFMTSVSGQSYLFNLQGKLITKQGETMQPFLNYGSGMYLINNKMANSNMNNARKVTR